MAFTIDMNRFREVTGTQAPVAAPAFDKPMTYEDRLLGDLPARIAKAQELIGSGLDYQAGLKELDFVDSWAKDPKNAQALTTILSDKANDPQTLAMKQSALRIYSRQGFDIMRARAEVNSGPKTFAISILQDIPAARRKAEALLASGDIENGKIALEEVRSLTKKNSGMTEMLFNYTGDNPMLKKAQEVMLGSSDWETKIAPLTDGSTNRAAPDFYIRQNNLGANQGFFFKNAVQGDPQTKRVATSVMSVFGQAPAAPRRQAQGQEDQPQAPLYDAEGGFSYVKKALDVGGDAVDFGDPYVVTKAKQLFEAGDGDNNGAGMTFALDAARKSRELRGTDDPALDKGAFMQAADTYALAIGGASTAEKKREAGAAFLELTAGLSPEEAQTSGRQAAQAVDGAYRSLSVFSDLGYDATRSAKHLAGVQFKKNRGLQLSPEEAAVDTTFATSRKFKSGITERLRTEQEVDSKGQPVDSGLYVGFDTFNTGFAQAVNSITGEALERGEKLDEVSFRQKFTDPNGVGMRKLTGLVRGLDPMADEETAKGAAAIMADVFATTGKIDAAKLGSYVTAAKRAKAGANAAVVDAPDGAIPAGTKAAARGEITDAAKQTVASITDADSPDRRFLEKAIDMDLRDAAWYSLSSWDLAAGGRGANKLREVLQASWSANPEVPGSSAPIKKVFSGNQRVTEYVRSLSSDDILSDSKRAERAGEIANMIMEDLTNQSGVVRAAMADADVTARVQRVADTYANTYLADIKGELRGTKGATVGDVLPDAILRSIAPDKIAQQAKTKEGREFRASALNELTKDRTFRIPTEQVLTDAILPPGSETDSARRLLDSVRQSVQTGFADAVDTLSDREQVSAEIAIAGKTAAEAKAIADTLQRVYDRVSKPITDKKTLEYGERIRMMAGQPLSGVTPDNVDALVSAFYNEAQDNTVVPAWMTFQKRRAEFAKQQTSDLQAQQTATAEAKLAMDIRRATELGKVKETAEGL
jgi:hypothetical protein